MPQSIDFATRTKVPPPKRPMCLACGDLMRLTAITPHEKKEHAELHMYECACGYRILGTVVRKSALVGPRS
jgi:hypothetical protein